MDEENPPRISHLPPSSKMEAHQLDALQRAQEFIGYWRRIGELKAEQDFKADKTKREYLGGTLPPG